jgi:hypothetical protein
MYIYENIYRVYTYICHVYISGYTMYMYGICMVYPLDSEYICMVYIWIVGTPDIVVVLRYRVSRYRVFADMTTMS